MASGLFDYGRNEFAKGSIHWKSGGDTIKCLLVDTGVDTFTLNSDDFLNDILPTALVPNSVTTTTDYSEALTNSKTLTLSDPTAGVCDADDVTFCSVASTEASVEGLVLFKHITDETDDVLIAWVEFSAVTPNGGDITIQWDSGSNKIFKL